MNRTWSLPYPLDNASYTIGSGPWLHKFFGSYPLSSPPLVMDFIIIIVNLIITKSKEHNINTLLGTISESQRLEQ